MRSTVTLLAAAVLCVPAIGAEAQQPQQPSLTAAYETPLMMARNNPQLAHWQGWGQSGSWGSQEMGLEHPEAGWGYGSSPDQDWGDQRRGWGHPGMGWGGQGMGWGPQGPMSGNMAQLMTMLPLIIAMVDTDGDGAMSLEEHQAVHNRMFNYFDANKDGKLSPQEVQTAFQGGTSTTTSQPSTTSQPTPTGQPGTTNQ